MGLKQEWKDIRHLKGHERKRNGPADIQRHWQKDFTIYISTGEDSAATWLIISNCRILSIFKKDDANAKV